VVAVNANSLEFSVVVPESDEGLNGLVSTNLDLVTMNAIMVGVRQIPLRILRFNGEELLQTVVAQTRSSELFTNNSEIASKEAMMITVSPRMATSSFKVVRISVRVYKQDILWKDDGAFRCIYGS
jgi:hypothetical protein